MHIALFLGFFSAQTSCLVKISLPFQFLCIFAFSFPFLLAFLLLSLPLSLLGFLLWFPLQFCRRPYIYVEQRYADSSAVPTWTPASKNTFKIATANVCLLPEFATRANNLNAPGERAGVIVAKIVDETKFGAATARPEAVVVAVEDRPGTPLSTDSLLKHARLNEDDRSTDGDAMLAESSDAHCFIRATSAVTAADEKASQRSLYSQLYKIKAMDNPVVSLRDHRLEPADIRSKEFDSNLCLTSANHSIAALDNASCDEKTETGSVNEDW